MDWLGDHLTAAWLGIAILLGVAELVSMDLILLMLAVGALVGMVLAIIGAPFAVQALVAAGVVHRLPRAGPPLAGQAAAHRPGPAARPRQAGRQPRAW